MKYYHHLCHTANVRNKPDDFIAADETEYVRTTDIDTNGCGSPVQNIHLSLVGLYFLSYICDFMFTCQNFVLLSII